MICPHCHHNAAEEIWKVHLRVCPHCGHHVRLRASERIAQLLDAESWHEFDGDLTASDRLSFVDTQPYRDRLADAQAHYGMRDAILTGSGAIAGFPLILAVMDFHFLGGSMGTVVGEKITRAIERATAEKSPLLIVSASGGARMQEGTFSLMQMAKIVSALGRFRDQGLFYLSLLTDPTTGGVAASFATLGDVHLSEPGATIAFAGRRVIEQTLRQSLPADFQSAESADQRGLIDAVIHRSQMREAIARLLQFHSHPSPASGEEKIVSA